MFHPLGTVIYMDCSSWPCQKYNNNISSTVFDLITAHTPISAQSSNSVDFRLQPVYFFVYFFIKAYVVGTHLNCIDLKIRKKKSHNHHQISPFLIFFIMYP